MWPKHSLFSTHTENLLEFQTGRTSKFNLRLATGTKLWQRIFHWQPELQQKLLDLVGKYKYMVTFLVADLHPKSTGSLWIQSKTLLIRPRLTLDTSLKKVM
eukprot:GABV01001243.1.p2 GENE.GABV01001243.1~~GABV01001243.1.p2  ORF type:complete len:101 (-),score=15.57 GABV01001243.1:415-717(-)